MRYVLGAEIIGMRKKPGDYAPVNDPPPKSIGINGISAWSEWTFSASTLTFRQIGGNSNGLEWDRTYQAIPSTSRACPAHETDD